MAALSEQGPGLPGRCWDTLPVNSFTLETHLAYYRRREAHSPHVVTIQSFGLGSAMFCAASSGSVCPLGGLFSSALPPTSHWLTAAAVWAMRAAPGVTTSCNTGNQWSRAAPRPTSDRCRTGPLRPLDSRSPS